MKDVKNIETHFPDKRSMIVKLSEYTPSTNSFDPPMTLGKPKEDPVCMAMDGCIKNVLSGFRDELFAAGAPAFLGYAMLSNVSQEALIRAGVETIADEMTRKFIQFTYDDDDGKENHEKEINEIETEACRFKIKERFNLAAQKDGYFGGCLAYIDMGDISDEEKMEPLVLDTKTFKKGSFRGLKIIEPINIYAGTYNTSDPTDEHYFNPEFWYILGKPYHASRFLYFASNPAPLLLKPAYNFFGIPRAQMALDYVAHFVENRESAQNLLNKFSLTCWKTDLTQMLQGEGINSIMNRVKGFNAMRHNGGSLVVDKETEDIVQINTPLGGVREIVDMSLNLLTAVWRIPKIKYIGEGEGGLNASSKEQMRSFYDFILSQKEKMFTEPMEKLLKILQLNLGKEVNEAIGFKWPSMVELDEQDRATLNKQKADRDIAYINAGVLSQEEVRQALSLDSNSDYAMIDVDDVPEQENMGDVEKDEMAQDAALAEDGRWITIGHRDPEGEDDEGRKGRHIYLENGETPEEAINKLKKDDEDKKEEPKKEDKPEEPKKEENKKEYSKSEQKEEPKEAPKGEPKKEKTEQELRDETSELGKRRRALRDQIEKEKDAYIEGNSEYQKIRKEEEDARSAEDTDWDKVWSLNQKRHEKYDALAEEYEKKETEAKKQYAEVLKKIDSARSEISDLRHKRIMDEVKQFTKAYNEFKDSATVEDANNYAKLISANGGRFSEKDNVHTANIMNKTLTGLMAKYEMTGKLNTYGEGHMGATTVMHANNDLIEISPTYARMSDDEIKKTFERRRTRERAQKQLSELEKKREDAKSRGEVTWMLDAEIANAKAASIYRCFTVQTSAENYIRDTVMHEFGHTLMFRKMVEEITKGEFGGEEINLSLIGKKALTATKIGSSIRKAYKKARSTGDIHEISEYANTNYHEFFAETFAMRESGQKLPDYIEDMLKEVTGK